MRRNNITFLDVQPIEWRGSEDENYTARGTEKGLYTRSWLPQRVRYAVHSSIVSPSNRSEGSILLQARILSLSLSLLTATEAFHRISIIILVYGTFYTSVGVIMCDGRTAAIERGINNHLITPGQLILARRINMGEGKIGIYRVNVWREERRRGGGQSMVKRFKWTGRLFGYRDT